MAITPTPKIPALSPAPTTNDPANFDSRADSFLGSLPSWGVAVKAVGDATQANAGEAQAQAVEATAQAVIAAQQANQAGLSVAAAQAVAGALPFNPATYYAQYAVAISPGNRQNYRRNTAGSSATDPKDDPANWTPLLLLQLLPMVSIATDTVGTASIHYIFTASCKLTLPASPSVGDVIGFENGSGVKTCTIDPNGNKIRGDASVMRINSKSAAETLVFSGTTFGWIRA